MSQSLQFLLLITLLSAACATTKPTQTTTPTAADPKKTQLANLDAAPTKMGEPVPGEEVEKFDANNDQKPDVFRFYSLDARGAAKAARDAGSTDVPDVPMLRKEVDLNCDGTLDSWTWFDKNGLTEKQVFDLDFDGRIDLNIFYEKGIVIKKEVFHSFSQRPDTFKFYEKGKIANIQRDTNNDGKVDQWEYYEGEQIDRIGTDLDNDGSADKWYRPPKKEK